jgi:hypothetical protein
MPGAMKSGAVCPLEQMIPVRGQDSRHFGSRGGVDMLFACGAGLEFPEISGKARTDFAFFF